jgi:hypothetical protein
MRLTLVAAVLTGALVASGGCTSGKPKPAPTRLPGGSAVVLRITPAKAQYARGEQIVLSVEVRNTTAGACQVSQVPEGVIVVLSLTRDGEAVAPAQTSGSYIDGFAAYLRRNLVSLAPGKSVTMSIRSERSGAVEDRPALETSAVDGLDEAALSFWPVDAPGKYTLSARYVLPPLADAPADVCLASGDPVSADFTVLGG